MAISKDLLDILVCPECKGALELKADESGKIAGNLEPMIPRAKCGSSSGLSSAANGLGTRLRTFFRIASLPWPAFRRPLQSDASMR